jgi:hypothetical protein
MTSEIYDWEATLHKMVTSKAGDLVGNVDAVDDTSILVSTEGARTHYKIPKHMVEGYDGQCIAPIRHGHLAAVQVERSLLRLNR